MAKEEKKQLTPEEKVALAKKGLAGGIATTGLGGAMVGGGYALDWMKKHNIDPEKMGKYYKKLDKSGKSAWNKNSTKLKATGALVTTAGLGVTGYTAYQHYKNKKKLEEKKDETKEDKK